MFFSQRKPSSVRLLLVVVAALWIAPGADRLSAAEPYCGAICDRPCGPEWLPGPLKLLIPQQVGGADFRAACRAHDWCYTTGAMSRRDCDLAFRANLLAACACSRRPLACRMTARTMFVSSRLFGRRAYWGPRNW